MFLWISLVDADLKDWIIDDKEPGLVPFTSSLITGKRKEGDCF
jgi:hypothetical protein